MEYEKPFLMTHIEKVKRCGDSWEICTRGGMCFLFDVKYGVKPRVGQVVSFYGAGEFRQIRGLKIGTEMVFYRTKEQQEEINRQQAKDYDNNQMKEFEEKKGELDTQYAALPDVFKRRLDKFRTNNPEFRWKYEGYEMFVCTEAMKIAEALSENAASIRIFAGLSYAEQMRQVKLADGHSGNTFGAAVHLAWLYSTNPENVVKLHGALAPLVGSEEYGCVPKGTED